MNTEQRIKALELQIDNLNEQLKELREEVYGHITHMMLGQLALMQHCGIESIDVDTVIKNEMRKENERD